MEITDSMAPLKDTISAQRDRVNKKVMKDPRIAPMMDLKTMPFDGKRLIYGGFKLLVAA